MSSFSLKFSLFFKRSLNLFLLDQAVLRGGTCAKFGVWMMAITSFRQLSLLVAVGLALTACGGETVNQEELMRVADKFKIKDSEKPAFKACMATSEGNAPYVKIGIKTMLLASVPVEICGCQSKTIAQTFKKDKVGAYGSFITWTTKAARKGSPKFEKGTFSETTDIKWIRDKLVQSLDGCSAQFVKDNLEVAKTLLTPYVDPAQLKKEAAEKKKKEAEAKAKAEAAKKSET
jgi:hypothetical protein